MSDKPTNQELFEAGMRGLQAEGTIAASLDITAFVAELQKPSILGHELMVVPDNEVSLRSLALKLLGRAGIKFCGLNIPAILAGTHHLSSHKPATLDDILEMIFGDDDDLEDEFPFLGPNPFIRRSPSSPFMFREKLRRGYPGQSGFSMGGGFSGVIEILQIMIAAQKARAAAAEAAAAKKPAQPDTDAPAAEEHGDQVNG